MHTINQFKSYKKLKKENSISKANKTQNNKTITHNNYSCNTWFVPNKKKNILKKI